MLMVASQEYSSSRCGILVARSIAGAYKPTWTIALSLRIYDPARADLFGVHISADAEKSCLI